MFGVQIKDRKKLIFGLNETIDHFDMANSVCWYDLRREDEKGIRF